MWSNLRKSGSAWQFSVGSSLLPDLMLEAVSVALGSCYLAAYSLASFLLLLYTGSHGLCCLGNYLCFGDKDQVDILDG